MTIKKAVLFLIKIVLASLGFYVGIVLGSLLAGFMGLPVPPMPAGADATTLMQYQWVMSVIFAGTLAVVSRNLTGSFLTRFLILSWFSWLVFSLNTYLEAALFTTYNGATPFTLVVQLVAVVLCSALVAWLFPSVAKDTAVKTRISGFINQFHFTQWSWRLLLAWLAFPVTYVLFGWVVQPFVMTYYEQQFAGLTAPEWGEIIPVLLLRSLIFLLACLPMLIFWQKSRRHLFFTLGTVMFILVGGLYMLQAYWYPLPMRIAHSLEILADSFVYVAALVTLLTKEIAHNEVKNSIYTHSSDQGQVSSLDQA